jgi:cob(I)alamin adenosyltransferase
MSIATRTGDQGETSLLGGVRVPKDHNRIRAYGALDELNSCLGIIVSELDDQFSAEKTDLQRIQSDLFTLGSELATPRGEDMNFVLLSDPAVEALDQSIAKWESSLPALRNFILPGGTPSSSRTHFARTICRRSEREMMALHRAEPLRPEVLRYINRLGDYLFMLARHFNVAAGEQEIPWVAPKPTK